QPVESEPMDARQQAPVAPFERRRAGMETPAQDEPFGLQGQQGGLDFGCRKVKQFRQSRRGDGSGNFQPSANQLPYRVRALPLALQLRVGRNDGRLDMASGINRLRQRQSLGRNPERPLAGWLM